MLHFTVHSYSKQSLLHSGITYNGTTAVVTRTKGSTDLFINIKCYSTIKNEKCRGGTHSGLWTLQTVAVVHNFMSQGHGQHIKLQLFTEFGPGSLSGGFNLAPQWRGPAWQKTAGSAGQMQFRKCGATCEKWYKMEDYTQSHVVFLCMPSWKTVELPLSLRDHQEGTVEFNYLERGVGSSRYTRSLRGFDLTNPNKYQNQKWIVLSIQREPLNYRVH